VLIQRARPRLRPPGNVVLRVSRSHPLSTNLVACIVTGAQFGLARDLITGSLFTGTNAPTMGVSSDGPALDLSGTAFISAPNVPEWNVLGDITVAWRGLSRNVGGGGALIGKIPAGGNGGTNTPFSLEYANPTSGRASFVRSNTGLDNYRVWQSNSAALSNNVLAAISVSQGSDISAAPTFYLDGVSTGATSQYVGIGSGAPTGNTDPLTLGRRPDGALQHDGLTQIVLVAALQWEVGQHQIFALSPYGVLEEAPRWYFANTGAVGPLSAEIAGTVDITASVSAALALDATIAGTVDVTASVAATTTLDAEIAGTVPITADISARLDRLAEIAGTIPITASITAFMEGGAGDTHDGFLRRSRRQRALEAAERRRDAERLADARALRLELEAALGMAADAVEEAPAPAVEAVREAVAVVRALPPVAPAIDFAAARAAVSDLLAAIEAARRAKELADDDEDVEILLRAL
jgi:hypothetical protein